MTVFFMCQGEQKRLGYLGYPKHLIYLSSDDSKSEDEIETILGRTVRLVRELAPHETELVVVGHPAHHEIAGEYDVELVTLPDPGACVLDGIARTLDQFGYADVRGWKCTVPRTTVLLGDVVFSRAALAQVLAETRPLVFSGTPHLAGSRGELFAMSFDAATAGTVGALLKTAPCRSERGLRRRMFPNQMGGHLRRLLWWAMQDANLKPSSETANWHPSLYLQIKDWTRDIDTPADVERIPVVIAELEAEEAIARLTRKNLG